jgi:hypothetical protein
MSSRIFQWAATGTFDQQAGGVPSISGCWETCSSRLDFVAGIGADVLSLRDELGDGPPARKITAFSAAGFGMTMTTQLPPEGAAD